MKRRRLQVQLSERQQLVLALLLVLLIAISLLYCVGLGSLALREVWRQTPLPSEGTGLPQEIEMGPTGLPTQSPLPTPVGP